MRLNALKTHELTINFSRSRPQFSPIKIDNIEIDTVNQAKLVGITIQDDLKWDHNTDNILNKARKRLFFMKKLKSSGASQTDLKQFYTSIVRPICEYAAPVWATSLTVLQKQQIETIQKRAIHIIFPCDNYSDGLSKLNLDTLEEINCAKVFSIRSS